MTRLEPFVVWVGAQLELTQRCQIKEGAHLVSMQLQGKARVMNLLGSVIVEAVFGRYRISECTVLIIKSCAQHHFARHDCPAGLPHDIENDLCW